MLADRRTIRVFSYSFAFAKRISIVMLERISNRVFLKLGWPKRPLALFDMATRSEGADDADGEQAEIHPVGGVAILPDDAEAQPDKEERGR